MNERDDDFVKLSDVLRVFLNYKKIAIYTFIVCIVITIFFGTTHVAKYQYTLDIQPPRYFNDNGNAKYIGCREIETASAKSYLALLKQSFALVSKTQLEIVNNTCSVELNAIATEQQKTEILNMYGNILNSIYSNPMLQDVVQHWKKVISENAKEPINPNSNQFTDYMLELSLRAKTQKLMIDSLNERPTNVKNTLRSTKPKNMTQTQIFVFGFIASIFASIFSAFLANVISKIRKELKDNKL